MVQILDSAMPDWMELLTELLQDDIFTSAMFECLKTIDTPPGPKLVWSTQQAANAVALSAEAGFEETPLAACAYRCIQKFEELLHDDHDSPLLLRVLGLVASESAEETTVDGMLERLGSRQSRHFAFSPLLAFIRSQLDPAHDPTGEKAEKLREELGERLAAIEGIESRFLRKELKGGQV
jgi:hypothetical protein